MGGGEIIDEEHKIDAINFSRLSKPPSSTSGSLTPASNQDTTTTSSSRSHHQAAAQTRHSWQIVQAPPESAEGKVKAVERISTGDWEHRTKDLIWEDEEEEDQDREWEEDMHSFDSRVFSNLGGRLAAMEGVGDDLSTSIMRQTSTQQQPGQQPSVPNPSQRRQQAISRQAQNVAQHPPQPLGARRPQRKPLQQQQQGTTPPQPATRRPKNSRDRREQKVGTGAAADPVARRLGLTEDKKVVVRTAAHAAAQTEVHQGGVVWQQQGWVYVAAGVTLALLGVAWGLHAQRSSAEWAQQLAEMQADRERLAQQLEQATSQEPFCLTEFLRGWTSDRLTEAQSLLAPASDFAYGFTRDRLVEAQSALAPVGQFAYGFTRDRLVELSGAAEGASQTASDLFWGNYEYLTARGQEVLSGDNVGPAEMAEVYAAGMG